MEDIDRKMNIVNTEALVTSISIARRERLEMGLLHLAQWAKRRADGDFNVETTTSILTRKVGELKDAVDRAGWRAREEFSTSNNEVNHD